MNIRIITVMIARSPHVPICIKKIGKVFIIITCSFFCGETIERTVCYYYHMVKKEPRRKWATLILKSLIAGYLPLAAFFVIGTSFENDFSEEFGDFAVLVALLLPFAAWFIVLPISAIALLVFLDIEENKKK